MTYVCLILQLDCDAILEITFNVMTEECEENKESMSDIPGEVCVGGKLLLETAFQVYHET